MDTNQTHETSTPDADNCGALRTKSGQEIQPAERPTPETDTLYNPENGWTGVVPINHARRLERRLTVAREALEGISHDMAATQQIHDLCIQAITQTAPKP